MTTARPFAYNTGTTITGTYQVGDIAIGKDEIDYSSDPGGVKWWMGPNEDSGNIIAYSVPTMNHPTQSGNIAGIGFKRTTFNDQSFVDFVNSQYGQSFTSAESASSWLTMNGYWNSLDPIPKTAIYDGHTVAWYDSSDLDTIVKDGSNAVSLWRNKLQDEGTELVVNGGFNGGNGWGMEAEWTIGNGVASVDCSSSKCLYQTPMFTNGKYYKVKITVTSYNTGYLQLQNGISQVFGSISGEGTYSFYFLSDNSGVLYIYGVNTTKLSINNVSVKEITGNNLMQLTATNQPLWTSEGILFDGIDNFMETPAFTWNQPCFVYMVFKQISYTVNDYIFDGNSFPSTVFGQVGLLSLWAGLGWYPSDNINYSDSFILSRVLFNGSSSSIQINDNLKLIGNPGTNNAGGFTLGSGAEGSYYFSNIQVKEIICRDVADSAADEEQIYNYLKEKYFSVNDGNTVAWYDSQDLKTVVKDGSNNVSIWLDKSKGCPNVLGEELITNVADREFSSDTGWWGGTNYWSISGGKATAVDLNTNYTLYKLNLLTIGALYKLTFTILDYSTGYLYPIWANDNPVTNHLYISGDYPNKDGIAYSGDGTYSLVFLAQSTTLAFSGYYTTNLSIDNVSCVLVDDTSHHLIQPTGTNQPLWSTDGITFDGIDNFMSTYDFNLQFPTKIYLVFKLSTWSFNGWIIDSVRNAINSGLYQAYDYPQLSVWTGNARITNTESKFGVFEIVRSLLNNELSEIQINDGNKILGYTGANYMGGITIGCSQQLNNFSNVIIKEIIFRNVVDSASDEQKIYNYLASKYFGPKPAYDGHTVAWYDSSALGTIVKDGSNAVSLWMNKLQVESPELCVNGGFADGTGWALNGTGVSISGGVGVFDNCSASANIQQSPTSFISGKLYKITLTILTISSGGLAIFFCDSNTSYITSVGTHSVLFYGNSSNTQFFVLGQLSTTATIDNISIKEVTGQHLIQLTATNQPTWSTDGITFDGIDNYMKTLAFTLNQPTMVYLVVKIISHAQWDYIFDGLTYLGGSVLMENPSPSIEAGADGGGGSVSPLNANLAVGSLGIIRVLFNGASSKLQVNETTAVTWTDVTLNMGGITLGSEVNLVGLYGNILVKEAIFRNVSENPADEEIIYKYLKIKHGSTDPIYDGNTVAWYDSTDLNTVKKSYYNNSVGGWLDKLGQHTYGQELIENNDFNTSDGWYLSNGCTISGGKLNFTGQSTNDRSYRSVTQGVGGGKTYKFEVTISNYSSGTLYIIPNGVDAYQTGMNSNGIHTFIISTFDTVGLNYYYLVGDLFIGSVDIVSVKQVNGNILTQLVDAKRPIWSSDGILFDGSDDWMQTTVFNSSNIGTVYLLLKQITFNIGDIILDGDSDYSLRLDQYGSSPNLMTPIGETISLPLDTFKIIRLVIGSSGKSQLNEDYPVTGSCSNISITKISFGRFGSWEGGISNFQIKEAIFRNTVDDEDTQLMITRYLKNKYSITY